MNLATISGRLGKDPELQKTTTGLSVTNFSLAIDEYKPNEDTPTTWVQCQAWREKAENLAEMVKTGDKVAIVGHLKVDTWEDNRQTRYKTYIVVDRWEFMTKSTKKSVATSVKLKDIKPEAPSEDLPF